jgi:fatty acid desaturase
VHKMKSQVSVAKFPLSAGILYRGNPPALFTRHDVEWKCQKCGSTDLKKVSLVYQDGLSQTKSRSRLVGLLFGAQGPGIVTGTSVRQGVLQSELSKSLNPPTKWSFTKLVAGSFVLTCLALFAYIVFASASAPPVSTLPVKLYVFLAPVAFLFVAFATWRHNHLVYPRAYNKWDRSFICQRCGTISSHNT